MIPAHAHFARSNSKAGWASLGIGERTFVESIREATDAASLDSLRVPCLNAKLAIQELSHELETGLLSGVEWCGILAETQSLLNSDQFFQNFAPCRRLRDKFDAVSKIKDIEKLGQKDLQGHREMVELRFILADALPQLEKSYAEGVAASLKQAVVNQDSVVTVTCLRAFLSEMVHRGWTLAGLGKWVPYFLNSGRPSRTFDEHYQFWIAQLLRNPQPFRVTLRLNGAADLVDLQELGSFSFSAISPDAGRAPESFIKPEPAPAFVTTEILAVDYESAAHSACEAFEHCLDRLRFNFRDAPVRIDQDAFIIRLGDNRHWLQRIEHQIPNPEYKLPQALFLKTSKRIDDLLREDRIDARSRERLRSAARHYRMGRDAETFRDKFLNWWLGLEFLCHLGDGGGIGRSVKAKAVDVMTVRYFWWQITDLAVRISRHIKVWPKEISAMAANRRKVGAQQIILIAQDVTARQSVINRLQDFPSLQSRFSELSDILSSASKSLQFIKDHRRRLDWHLDRLYRIRCCLVHGSPIFLKLQLPAANLEFYLREVLSVALMTLDGQSHVVTLEEFYIRAGMCWKHMETDLAALKNDPPTVGALLPKLIFA